MNVLTCAVYKIFTIAHNHVRMILCKGSDFIRHDNDIGQESWTYRSIFIEISFLFFFISSYTRFISFTSCCNHQLTCRLYFPLQRYCGEGTPSTAPPIGSANRLVDLTTTFHNFRPTEIGYFINSLAIYLSYPSDSHSL
mgnify:CR=1 FL=1